MLSFKEGLLLQRLILQTLLNPYLCLKLGGKGSCGVIQPYILYPVFQVKKNRFLVTFKTNPAIVKESALLSESEMELKEFQTQNCPSLLLDMSLLFDMSLQFSLIFFKTTEI